MDLICGEYGKKIYIYYGDGNGSISGGGPITDADGSQEFGYDRFNGPGLIDMNGDGLKDLLVANCNNGKYVNGYDGPGPLRYYQNVGKVGEPLFKFVENVKDTAGTEIAHVYHRINVADMDNDGLDDLITSNTPDKNGTDTMSAIYYYRNCGTQNEYKFEPGVRLDVQDKAKLPLRHATRLGVSDINNDGVQDLIINASHHYPGRAGILLGKLETAIDGTTQYTLQDKQMMFTLTGSHLQLNSSCEVKIIAPSGKVIKSTDDIRSVNLEKFDLVPGIHLLQVNNGVDVQVEKYIQK